MITIDSIRPYHATTTTCWNGIDIVLLSKRLPPYFFPGRSIHCNDISHLIMAYDYLLFCPIFETHRAYTTSPRGIPIMSIRNSYMQNSSVSYEWCRPYYIPVSDVY